MTASFPEDQPKKRRHDTASSLLTLAAVDKAVTELAQTACRSGVAFNPSAKGRPAHT